MTAYLTAPLEKVCSCCDESKPVDGFYMQKGKPESLCKECRRAKNKEWRQANPDKMAGYKRADRARNPERSSRNRRRWYETSRDSLIAYQKEYQKAHRAERAAIRAARRSAGEVLLVLEREVRRIKASCCVACGSRDRIDIDHVVPLSRGGRHAIGNLQPMCRSCNSSKSSKLMIEWKRYRSVIGRAA